jgi:hypothetical protein
LKNNGCDIRKARLDDILYPTLMASRVQGGGRRTLGTE